MVRSSKYLGSDIKNPTTHCINNQLYHNKHHYHELVLPAYIIGYPRVNGIMLIVKISSIDQDEKPILNE